MSKTVIREEAMTISSNVIAVPVYSEVGVYQMFVSWTQEIYMVK